MAQVSDANNEGSLCTAVLNASSWLNDNIVSEKVAAASNASKLRRLHTGFAQACVHLSTTFDRERKQILDMLAEGGGTSGQLSANACRHGVELVARVISAHMPSIVFEAWLLGNSFGDVLLLSARSLTI